ncbi:hypothetical protein LOC68_17435 [Blastopirellula sp. JC732]|uniref:Leucine Rich repeats (2 copies) n=1 Tax=Blastopirellula sediminis TaxID=2894196 RepID=A0A9X1MPV1_9BACT|nr:hypothetical protein [Blastopirellula sediminis]MCC9606522.1 hypothetical protein [Blastopirellula sediminis]MCC9630180.1 hypothetical protein [Blastopirellula sediminis]
MESEESPLPTTATPPRRWRLRFSLRTLVIITPLFALFFAWIGGEKLRHDQDQAAAEKIGSRHSFFLATPDEGTWTFSPLQMDQLLRGRLYHPYTSIEFAHLQADEDDWIAIGQFAAPKQVTIYSYRGPTTGETFSRLTSIQSLVLWYGEPTSNDLRQIQQLRHLRRLRISPSDDFTGPQNRKNAPTPINFQPPLLDIGPEPWPELEFLHLSNQQLPVLAMEAIAASTQLQDLRLVNCVVPPHGLRQLKDLTELQHLSLIWRPDSLPKNEPASHGVMDEVTLNHLGRLEKLETLAFHHAQLRNFGGDNAPNRWPSLYDLQLDHVHLSKQAVEEIAAIPRLQSLYVKACTIDPDAMKAFQGARNLVEVRLSDPGDNELLVEGLASLPQLEALFFQGETVTDQTMKRIAKLNDLQFLSLDDTLVSDEGIALLETHPQLLTIQIHGGQVTNSALASLVRIKTLILPLCAFDSTRIDPNLLDEVRQAAYEGKDVTALLEQKGIFPASPPKP